MTSRAIPPIASAAALSSASPEGDGENFLLRRRLVSSLCFKRNLDLRTAHAWFKTNQLLMRRENNYKKAVQKEEETSDIFL
jgi:hypothetical protein